MLIRLLCAHEMTKHVCKISRLNSKRLLRKLQNLLGGYFILPHPVVRSPPKTLSCQILSLAQTIWSRIMGYKKLRGIWSHAAVYKGRLRLCKTFHWYRLGIHQDPQVIGPGPNRLSLVEWSTSKKSFHPLDVLLYQILSLLHKW